VIAYVDASVLLRIVFGEPTALREWDTIETPVASPLVEGECLRSVDRFRLEKGLRDEEILPRREEIYRFTGSMDVVELDRAVLSRASQPLSSILRTLDAIHLASALIWREQSDTDLVMATHDFALAAAARAHGMRVVGV
jgi:predicted nucleic acid-binding protein